MVTVKSGNCDRLVVQLVFQLKVKIIIIKWYTHTQYSCSYIRQSTCTSSFTPFSYLALVGYPLVVSTLAPPTLSAPQLLMASQTRDRLDEGSHSPRSEPLDGTRGGGGADGAAFWTGGLICRESKCAAQSSWSSVCRDTLKNKLMNRKTDNHDFNMKYRST